MSENLGIVVILISALGYFSNWLNWRFINYPFVRWLYYAGALIHETSHAILCFITRAKILEFRVFAKQPRVVYTPPPIAVVGNVLISFAPIAGGLLFLFLINRYALGGYFSVPQFSGWQALPAELLNLLAQINLLRWQSWILILLFLNSGAMIGPSWQDLKNVWPALIILLFVKSHLLAHLGFLAVMLILANIVIQIVLAVIIKLIKSLNPSTG